MARYAYHAASRRDSSGVLLMITYKIVELEQFKKPLGIYVVWRIEKVGRIVIHSNVFETKNKNDALKYIKGVTKV